MIKLYKKFFFFLSLVGACYHLNANLTTLVFSRPTLNQVNFDFVRNCCKQAEELRADLLEIIHDLSQDIDYWKMQKLTTIKYFISKGPTGWISEKTQQQELNEKIAFLKQALELNAYYLGTIQHYLGKNYKEKSAEEIEENMRELLLIIQQCVLREIADNTQSSQTHDVQWAELFFSNKKNLITFKTRMKTAYYGYKKPNHFRRNWLPYSIASISAVALAVYAYKNQEQIKQWHANAKLALDNYWQTHIVDPIVNSIDTLTDKSNLIEKQPINNKTVETERQARNEAIRSYRKQINNNQKAQGIFESLAYYCRNIRDYLLPRNKITEIADPLEIEKEIEEANQGNIDKIIRDRNILMKNSIKNIFWGELPQVAEIELLHAKTQGTEIAKEILDTYNKILRSYRLIIELLTLFPTYMLGKILYNSSKNIVHYFNQKNNTSLKKNIRLIHRTLNKYTNNSEISFIDQGLFVYWIHELKKNIDDIKLEDRSSFNEDLDDLLQQNFTIDQKKSILQQMYATYSFLRPC